MCTARTLTVSPSMLCSGGDAWSQGVHGPGGVISQHALRQTPLLTESQTPVKILPCPNFVARGKNNNGYGLIKTLRVNRRLQVVIPFQNNILTNSNPITNYIIVALERGNYIISLKVGSVSPCDQKGNLLRVLKDSTQFNSIPDRIYGCKIVCERACNNDIYIKVLMRSRQCLGFLPITFFVTGTFPAVDTGRS